MSARARLNFLDDEPWDEVNEKDRIRARRFGLTFGSDALGASLLELLPRSPRPPLHMHYGCEEMFFVLGGRPTLRTPEGERELEEGEAVHFGLGADGAHQVSNRTDEPVRYVFVSNVVSPEVVEYPDSGKVTALAKTTSQKGTPLHAIHRVDDAVDYFEGEPPR